MIKRLVDIVLSSIALLLFLPFGLIISAILRCTGEGYIFYLQERLGQGLRPFNVIKFSSMLKDSPKLGTGLITLRNDPRVFPFGRFLRKTKLNEIPQILNVLKGDMSIVGPRPMVAQDIDFLPIEIQQRVYSVKPGLTGIGSIVFRDEEKILSATKKDLRACYCEDIAPLKADLDLWYIDNQSMLLDLKLIFLTVWVILVPESQLYERILGERWAHFNERLDLLMGEVA